MKNSQSGFTIIELLVATAVFATILVVTTTTIIGISQTYVKGSVEGQTQQTARAVLNDISQAIQYSSVSANPKPTCAVSSCSNDEYYFCIGNDVYVYSLDKYLSSSSSLGAGNSSWVLIRYNNGSCPSQGNLPSPFPAGYAELLSPNERLGQLNIIGTTINGVQNYTLSIEVGYGSNELLQDSTYNSSPNYVNGATTPPSNYLFTYACQSGIDSSFCAVSSLTTTVAPRINST